MIISPSVHNPPVTFHFNAIPQTLYTMTFSFVASTIPNTTTGSIDPYTVMCHADCHTLAWFALLLSRFTPAKEGLDVIMKENSGLIENDGTRIWAFGHTSLFCC